MQWNDPASQVANRAAYPRIATDAAADGDMTTGPWLTRDFGPADCVAAVLATDPDLIVLEAEVPAEILTPNGPVDNPQAPDWEAVALALESFDIDKAVATSFSAFRKWVRVGDQWQLHPDPDRAAPLIERGWYCQPYVYPAEHQGMTVERAIAYASHYGPEWAHGEPVLGCYSGAHGSFTIDSPEFDGYDDQPGASLWDAGTVI